MNFSIIYLDRYLILTFLIICFQCFHSFSLNSFSKEFFIQLIPYFFMFSSLVKDKFIHFDKKIFSDLIIFNIICFLSIFWTSNFKYTMASNAELFITSITIMILYFYASLKKNGLLNIVKISLLAISLIIGFGIFSLDILERTFLGMSPSLFSSILNYGSVCSLYLFHVTKKKYPLFLFIIFFILCIYLSSLRGVFAIVMGILAYLNIFQCESDIVFYRRILFSVSLIAILYLTFTYFVDITYILKPDVMSFKEKILRDSINLKYTIKDIFLNKIDLSKYAYSGERVASIIIGIKETILKSPLIGFGHCNTKEIFALYGKETYSHNSLVEIFMGTGFLGLFFYLRFLIVSFCKPIKNDLLPWKRFATLVFGVHLMLGLSFENIPLALLTMIVISASNQEYSLSEIK